MPNDRRLAGSPANSDVIELCLRAAIDGPFFPGWEFQTLMGLDRDAARAVLDAWPDLPPAVPDGYTSAEQVQHAVVNNALNNLLGYPHSITGEAFLAQVGVSAEVVARALGRWRGQIPDLGNEISA